MDAKLLRLLAGKKWESSWYDLSNEAAKLGLTVEMRQSTISEYLTCPHKYQLNRDGEASGYVPKQMFFGSIFHEAVYSYSKTGKFDIDIALMAYLSENLVEERYQRIFKLRWFNTEVFYGMSADTLARMTATSLMAFGLEVLDQEMHLIRKIGNIVFSGTLDFFCRRKDGVYVILDTKTNGMADRFFDDESLTASSYSETQITYSPQHNHYGWMLYRFNGIEVGEYGYITPVNIIPVQRGPNKGKGRGDLIHSAASPGTGFLENVYERDLMNTVRAIIFSERNGYIRAYPTTYGKLECERCRFSSACLGIAEDVGIEIPDFARIR